MKGLILIIALFFSLSGLASPIKPTKDITVHKLTQFLDSSWARRVPRSLRSQRLSDLHIIKSHMTFRYKGLPFHIELVGEDSVALKFNGVEFSKEDLKDFKTAKRNFIKKFKIKRKYFSLTDLLFSKAYARSVMVDIPDSEIMRLQGMGYSVQGSGLPGFASQGFYPPMQPMLGSRCLSDMNICVNMLTSFLGAANQFMESPAFKGIFNMNRLNSLKPFSIESST